MFLSLSLSLALSSASFIPFFLLFTKVCCIRVRFVWSYFYEEQSRRRVFHDDAVVETRTKKRGASPRVESGKQQTRKNRPPWTGTSVPRSVKRTAAAMKSRLPKKDRAANVLFCRSPPRVSFFECLARVFQSLERVFQDPSRRNFDSFDLSQGHNGRNGSIVIEKREGIDRRWVERRWWKRPFRTSFCTRIFTSFRPMPNWSEAEIRLIGALCSPIDTFRSLQERRFLRDGSVSRERNARNVRFLTPPPLRPRSPINLVSLKNMYNTRSAIYTWLLPHSFLAFLSLVSSETRFYSTYNIYICTWLRETQVVILDLITFATISP